MRCTPAALALILTVSTSVTQAVVSQVPPKVMGTRVRVSVLGQRERMVGTVQEHSSDSLVITLPAEGGIRRTIAMDQVQRLETWTKRRHPVGKGWAVGTGLGALAGMLVGAVVEPVCEGGGWCIGPRDTGDMIVAGLAGGAVVGGLVGAIVGAALPSHKWSPINLSVIPADNAGTRLQMAWRVGLPPLRSP